MNPDEPRQSLFLPGLLAGKRGEAKHTCPYEKGSDERNIWMSGWEEGGEEFRNGGPPLPIRRITAKENADA